MKRFTDMKTYLSPAAAAVLLAVSAGPVSAEVYDLCVGQFDKGLPDGTTVPMWGYALGGSTDGVVCDNAPTVPGPRLTVTDGTLSVNLTNTLSEPTSIVIPGLPMPTSSGTGPTWNDDSTGPRTDPTQRVRSFGAEAAAGGGTEVYNFAVGRPGTFLYHSGTHPQKQVYMGLYGAVTQDAAAGEVYPGVAYGDEAILFYSDIDPSFNDAVVAGTLTTAIERHPSWFLVNGEPYVDGVTPDISLENPGDSNTLLRLLSATTETHVPVLQGLYMTLHAEDALQYAWEDTAAGTSGFAPREQYSAILPPLKTKDAILVDPAEGRYAVYDGNGYMTNPSDPEDFSVGDTVGGMFRFLSVTVPNLVAPVITSTPVLSTPVNALYEYQVTATDADGNPITYALIQGPAGMVMDGAGLVTWTPTLFDLGDHAVIVSASDFSFTTQQDYTLSVVPAGDGTEGALFFSNLSSAVAPPGVTGPYGNANVYGYDGAAYSTILYFVDTMGFTANVDGLQMVDADTFYISFANTEVTVPGVGAVQDEDVLLYDAGTWTVYFDGTGQGITDDIDAFSIVGSNLYFSTLGNVDVGGLGDPDDADVYMWDGATFSRALDASAVGLPYAADIDGLTVKGATYYMSFNRNGGTTVPVLGTVQDEAVVAYDGSTWSMYFSGPGLDLDDGQDVNAVHVP